MKYKVGDIVTIANKIGGHHFDMGSNVTIQKVNDTDYVATNGDEEWWIADENIEQGSKLSAKEFLLSRYQDRVMPQKEYEWDEETIQLTVEKIVQLMDEYKNQ